MVKSKGWEVGATVKVGFMTLKIVGIKAIKDGRPDIYEMVSLDGSKKYEFTPHYGIERIV